MKKKIIFGTALFIAVGLFMFTFANPNDKVSDDKSSKQTVKEVSSEDTTKDEQKTVEPEKKEQTNNTSTTTRRTSRRTTTTTPVVNPVLPQTPAQEAVNNDEIAKKEAEEKAKQEADDLLAYKEAAKEELDKYKKDEDYSDKNKEAVTEIKTDGKEAIDEAKTKDEVDEALKDAKDLIDALDTIAPVITVADDEELYQTEKDSFANLNNYTVTDNVSAADKIKVTISVTKDGNKLDKNVVNYKEPGTYVVSYTATDEAGNEASAVRNIKVNEVKAVGLILMSGDKDVTNTTDTYIAGTLPKDIKVYVKYNNGTTKRIHEKVCFIFCTDGYVKYGVINTSMPFIGTRTITYTYNNITPVTYSYKVIPRQVVSLEVINNKSSYIQGQALDLTVNATWNDGKVEKNVAYNTFANTNKVGNDQNGTVSYKGATGTFTYDVIARQVVSLQVINNKASYVQGQAFNLTVNATWNDGKVEKNVKYSTTANTNTVGKNQIGTVSYKGATGTFKFNVEAKTVVSLQVTNNKSSYIQGQSFNLTVNATWNDGTVEKNVEYTTTSNTNKVGKNQIGTVSYKGATGTFKFNVVAKTVVSLQVTNNKSSYIQGQALDLTVIATWNDGTKEENVNYTTTSNTNKVGKNQIGTVSYKGASGTFKFNVEAKAVVSLQVTNNKSSYIEGQPFDLTVDATWNDGTIEKNVNYTTTSNTLNVGKNQYGTVKYEGKTATFVFNVEAKVVTSLEVITNKTTYKKGEAFDIKVNATWNDGTKEENVRYTTTSNTNTIGKNQTATVSYKGKTATFKFDVEANITLRVTSTYTDYIKGEKINNITVYAKDASGRETKVTNYTITGDTSKVGYGQTATISYNGATVTYTYNVKYELHLIKHGFSYYLEFAENVNVKSIEYYNNKGVKSTIYVANDANYTNKSGNKYYLDNNQYGELHSMKGQHELQKLVVTTNDNATYTYTKVEVTNK